MKKNKDIYSVYFVNDNHLRKLYNLYIYQSKFEKFIDYLVFFAIIFTAMSLVLEFLIGIDNHLLHYLHLFSGFVFLIFILELLVEYVKSKSELEFFRQYWIDFILVVFLSFYFLFATYFGVSRLAKFLKYKNIISKLKHFKVSSKLFKSN